MNLSYNRSDTQSRGPSFDRLLDKKFAVFRVFCSLTAFCANVMYHTAESCSVSSTAERYEGCRHRYFQNGVKDRLGLKLETQVSKSYFFYYLIYFNVYGGHIEQELQLGHVTQLITFKMLICCI